MGPHRPSLTLPPDSTGHNGRRIFSLKSEQQFVLSCHSVIIQVAVSNSSRNQRAQLNLPII